MNTHYSINISIEKIKNPYNGLGQFSIAFKNYFTEYTPSNYQLQFLYESYNEVLKDTETVKYQKANILQQFFQICNQKFDIWHSLHQFPKYLPSSKSLHILTVHDLNFLIEKSKQKQQKYLKKLQKNIDGAAVITAISNYTKEQIEKHIKLKNKQIYVIHNGVELKKPDKEKPIKALLNTKFFFSIGVFQSKKNFHTLVEMLPFLKNYTLVIAGDHDTEYGKKIKMMINTLNFNQNVLLLGTVDFAEKYWLYQNCEAFLFPSLAEGFGMPVIEAMLCKKPVFLNPATSLIEIGGDAGFYFPSFEPVLMAQFIENKMQLFDENKVFHENQLLKQAEKFSWEIAIKKYLNLYQQVLNEKDNKL